MLRLLLVCESSEQLMMNLAYCADHLGKLYGWPSDFLVAVDPPADDASPSLAKVREAVVRFDGWEDSWYCGIT